MVLLPLFRWSCLRQGCYYLHVRPQTIHRASQHSTLAASSCLYITKHNTPILNVENNGQREPVRHKSNWVNNSPTKNEKREKNWGYKQHVKRERREQNVVIFSIATLMLYFLYLREPSDIDEMISRPIWVRLPGIDPEKAEGIMEMDHKYLGTPLDPEGLAQYKSDYYSSQAKHIMKEQQEEQHYQDLKATVTHSHK